MTSTPFDLDAARARRKEAAGDGVPFIFGGETFHIPPGTEWGLDIPMKAADGDLLGVFRDLLGDEQFERFVSHGPTVGDVETLFEHVNGEVVGGSGNS